MIDGVLASSYFPRESHKNPPVYNIKELMQNNHTRGQILICHYSGVNYFDHWIFFLYRNAVVLQIILLDHTAAV